MASREYLIFVLLLAVVLDAALIYWLRRFNRLRGLDKRSGGQIATLLGEYSPVLTWLRYSLPQWLRSTAARLDEQEPDEPEPDAGANPAAARVPLELAFDFSAVDRVSFTIERRAAVIPAPTAPDPDWTAPLQSPETALPTRSLAWQNLPARLRLPANAAVRGAGWTLLIFAAALPAILVVRDRWLELPFNLPWLDEFWEHNILARSISLPAYFAAVLGCWLALPWLVRVLGQPIDDPAGFSQDNPAGVSRVSALQRRVSAWGMAGAVICALSVFVLEIVTGQRFGGLYLGAVLVFILAGFLREHRPADILQTAKPHWMPALVMAALHILLMLFLYHYYGDRQFVWLWGLVLAGALLIVLRSSVSLPGIFWLVNFALILYTFRIDGWEFSVIGDEYSFFDYAQELARSQDWLSTLNKLFDGTAVYGSHPFISSVIQAFFARIFIGSSNFGWRISNLYLAALSLGLLYWFLRQFLTARVSLLAIALMAPAHYLMTFGKIGYNNLQALFAASLVLAAGAWAVRSRSFFPQVMLGLAAGLCFYVYPAALYCLPVVVLLVLFYDPPITLPARRRWLAAGLSLALLVLPLLVQADYWREKIPGTVLYQADIVISSASLGNHFASNLLYAFLSFLYIPQESHFVAVAYLDALTGIFFALGLCALLLSGWKSRFWAFILASFAASLFLVGTSHGGRFPPTTRMFLLLPFWTLIAALGLEWMLAQIRKLPRFPQTLPAWLLGSVLLAVLGLNLYQAYVLSPLRSTGYQSPVMLFMRIMEHIRGHTANEPQNLVFAFLTEPPWGIDGYSMMARNYDIPTDQVRLEKITVSANGLPLDSMEVLRSPRTVVMIYPEMDEGTRSALVEPVRALGKLPCAVRTLTGVTRFSLWVSPTMEWICAAGQ